MTTSTKPLGEWHRIDDPEHPAPKDGTKFLAFWKAPGADDPCIIVAKWSDRWGQFYGVNVQTLDGFGVISNISNGLTGELHATHWHPLPEPPRP